MVERCRTALGFVREGDKASLGGYQQASFARAAGSKPDTPRRIITPFGPAERFASRIARALLRADLLPQ